MISADRHSRHLTIPPVDAAFSGFDRHPFSADTSWYYSPVNAFKVKVAPIRGGLKSEGFLMNYGPWIRRARNSPKLRIVPLDRVNPAEKKLLARGTIAQHYCRPAKGPSNARNNWRLLQHHPGGRRGLRQLRRHALFLCPSLFAAIGAVRRVSCKAVTLAVIFGMAIGLVVLAAVNNPS
jgi:hypothetical protein